MNTAESTPRFFASRGAPTIPIIRNILFPLLSPPPPSLSLLPPVCSFSAVLSARLPTLLALVLKLSRTRRPRASFVRQPHQISSYRCPAFYACLLFHHFPVFFFLRFFPFLTLCALFQRCPPDDDFRRRLRRASKPREPGRMGSANGTAGKLLFLRCQIPRLRPRPRFLRDSSNF